MVRKPLRLRVDAERLVPWDDHVARGVAPRRRLFEVGTERCGVAGMTGDGVRSSAQIPLCEQVGVDVVVRDRAVFVGAGDAVDAEAPLRIVMTERAPEPGGLDQQLEADVELERLVAGDGLIADDGVADVTAEVEGRRAGRPVAGALVAANRPPRKTPRRRGRAGLPARARGQAWRGASAGRLRPRCGAAYVSTGRMNRSLSQNVCPS